MTPTVNAVHLTHPRPQNVDDYDPGFGSSIFSNTPPATAPSSYAPKPRTSISHPTPEGPSPPPATAPSSYAPKVRTSPPTNLDLLVSGQI